MSSVSADAPKSAADLTAPANGRRGAPEGAASGANSAPADFGPNEWLVDELYQRYQADPGSVDRAWWNFFADYHPKPP
jgi:2-oxoglutarate decarboxylase